MKIENSVALVTGANRGLGLAFARALVERGAKKVYAGARDPKSIAIPGVIPLRLDVTSADQIAAAAREAGDVTLVINNAGISRNSKLLAPDAVAALDAELRTNVVGPLLIARAFAPVLASHGGGAIVNMLSVVSWVSSPDLATYAVTKSAAWSMTNGLRQELRPQHTQVVGIHVGYIDTDLARAFDAPKSRPEDVVAAALDGVAAGLDEVIADQLSRDVKRGLSAGIYLGAR